MKNVAEENLDMIDFSLLNPPKMKSKSIAGTFQEAKVAYDKGDEARLLLLYECLLIFECKICSNLFRSFQSFMSHKRLFCCDKSMKNTDAKSNGAVDQGIRGSKESLLKTKSKNSDAHVSQSKSDESAHHGRSLIQPVPIAKLLSESAEEGMHTSSGSITSSRQQKEENTNDSAAMKGLNANNDGPKDAPSTDTKDNTVDNEEKFAEKPNTRNIGQIQFKCNICGIELQTSKALKVHIQKKHSYINNVSNCVMQCPSCSNSFSQTSALFQHLSVEHSFSMRRIRMLRDAIAKRRQQEQTKSIDNNAESKEASSVDDLKGLPLSAADAGGDNLALKNSLHSGDNSTNTFERCTICEKTFDRKEALAEHLASCKCSDAFPTMPTPSFCGAETTTTERQEQSPFFTMLAQVQTQDALDCSTSNGNSFFADLENKDFGCGLKTVSIGSLDALVGKSESTWAEHHELPPSTAEGAAALPLVGPLESAARENADLVPDQTVETLAGSAKKTPKIRKVAPIKQLCRCKICGKQFNALSNLRRHISMFHYRSRKYGCALCEYCAFRRYDIINHLMFVHKMTGERDSMSAEYVKVNEVNYTKDDMDGDIMLCSEAVIDTKEGGEGATAGITLDNPEAATSKSTSDSSANVAADTKEDLNIEKKIIKTYEKRVKSSQSEETPFVEPVKPDLKKEEENTTCTAAAQFCKELLDIKVEAENPEVQINTRQKLRLSLSATAFEANVSDSVADSIPDNKTDVSSTSDSFTETAPDKADTFTSHRRSLQGRLGEGRPRTPQRRPIRNRIKPVNKDFVYDLGAANQPPAETTTREINTRPVRRRNTVNKDSFVDRAFAMTVSFEPINPSENFKLINGSARRIALFLINQGQAVLSTLPEMPTARPQIRPRPISTCHDDINTMAPIIEATELEAARMSSTLLDDTFLREKISKQSTAEFRIKPCLALSQHSAVDTLLQKVDFSYQSRIHGPGVNSETQIRHTYSHESTSRMEPTGSNDAVTHASLPASTLSPISQLYDKVMNYEATPTSQSTPANVLPPAKPRKRNSMLARLDEANQMFIDSKYLRRALEN